VATSLEPAFFGENIREELGSSMEPLTVDELVGLNS
jgi:hypothetical protein